jgi:hypothetical protein
MNRYLRSRSSTGSSTGSSGSSGSNRSKKSPKRSSISEKYKDLSDEELAELIGISKLQFKKLNRLVEGKYMSRPDIDKFTDLMKKDVEGQRIESEESGNVIVMDYGRLKKRSKRSKKRSKKSHKRSSKRSKRSRKSKKSKKRSIRRKS